MKRNEQQRKLTSTWANLAHSHLYISPYFSPCNNRMAGLGSSLKGIEGGMSSSESYGGGGDNNMGGGSSMNSYGSVFQSHIF